MTGEQEALLLALADIVEYEMRGTRDSGLRDLRRDLVRAVRDVNEAKALREVGK